MVSTERPSWVPWGVDLDKPSAARVHDYFLGGSNNFEADREFARMVLGVLPDIRSIVRCNRAFLRRAIALMADQGIRQFLDLGSGVPTAGNTHEVAQRAALGSRVVYVDCEPVAVAHGELILQDNPDAVILRADLCDAGQVLDHPETRRLIDFDRPVGIIMSAVLHFVPDEWDPLALIARYRDATVPGSCIALSHVSTDERQEVDEVVRQYRQTCMPVFARTRVEVAGLFDGYRLFEPGVVATSAWRPETAPPDTGSPVTFAGVGLRT
jgi:SAM-dependent methyltransferase